MDKKVLAGVGIGGAIALVVGGQAVVGHLAAKELDKAIEDVSDIAIIEYQKVDHSFFGNGTTVKDVVITPVGSTDSIRAKEVVLYDFKEENDVPTYMNFAVNGIAMSSEAMAESTEIFSELGYDKDLDADFAAEYEYNADDKTVNLKKFKLGADDVGAMELSFQFANLTPDQTMVDNFPFSLFGAEFVGAKIQYSDDSFIDKILESTAEEQGITLKEAKEEAIKGLEADSADLPADFVKEMKNFINDPESFTITFDPDSPVPLSSLMGAVESPEAVVELLNITFDS
ncbi:MAG: hypothetical protein AAFV85_14900 [Cyanobacteria bacterium J06634_6]